MLGFHEKRSVQTLYADETTKHVQHTAYFGSQRIPLSLCFSTDNRGHNSLRVMHGISTTRTLEGSMQCAFPKQAADRPHESLVFQQYGGGVSFRVGYVGSWQLNVGLSQVHEQACLFLENFDIVVIFTFLYELITI